MDREAIPDQATLQRLVHEFPNGSIRAMASDISETPGTVSHALTGAQPKTDVQRKIYIWVKIMQGMKTPPRSLYNVEAKFFRDILIQRMIPDPTSVITVVDIIKNIRSVFSPYLYNLDDTRAAAIIHSNFPVDIHTDGDSAIGYRWITDSELVLK